jgi:VanZ family protein
MLALFQNFVIRWKLFNLYILFLVLLSVLPINSASSSSLNHIFVVSIRLDYLLHCLVYIPLVVFTWAEKEIDVFKAPFKAFIWIVILLVFGAITEWVQYFLPYRAFNINDLLANSLGVVIGFVIITIFRQFFYKIPYRIK